MTSRGAYGYRDYQRVVNWDGPLLYVQSLAALKTGKRLGVALPVARFAYLQGFMLAAKAPVNVVITWKLEEAGLVIARREFVIEQETAIPHRAQFRLQNLGPWAKIDLEPLEETTPYNLEANVFGTNRVHPLEFIPEKPVLLDNQHEFGAKAALTVWPSYYHAGPMRVKAFGSAAVVVGFSVESEITPEVFSRIDELIISGGNTITGVMIAPVGAWRLIIEAEGATTTHVTLIPTTTGAT